MFHRTAKMNLFRRSRNLLLVAATLLTLSQSLTVNAGHPDADPRKRPEQVEQDKSKKKSDSGILSEVRKAMEKAIHAILPHLRPGTGH